MSNVYPPVNVGHVILLLSGPDCPNIAPIHEDEMGRVSFRRNASNYRPLISEIVEYAKHQVDNFYLDLIDRLDLEEVEEDHDEGDDYGGSIFDDTRRDRMKSRMGLNVMEKTIKYMKRNGTWDRAGDGEEEDEEDNDSQDDGEYDEDEDDDAVERDLMDVGGGRVIPTSQPPLDLATNRELSTEVDQMLRIGDDSASFDPLLPIESRSSY